MQEQDTVTLKMDTEFVCSIVSKQIERFLKEKKGYDVDIHIEKIMMKEENGKIRVHFKGKMETERKELKKICKNSVLLKIIITLCLRCLSLARVGKLATDWVKKYNFI